MTNRTSVVPTPRMRSTSKARLDVCRSVHSETAAYIDYVDFQSFTERRMVAPVPRREARNVVIGRDVAVALLESQGITVGGVVNVELVIRPQDVAQLVVSYAVSQGLVDVLTSRAALSSEGT